MRRLLLALSLMMLVIPATVMAAGFPNGGFEGGFAGDGVANGWTAYAMPNWPACSPSTDAHSGAFSQAVFDAGEGGIYAQMSTRANFTYTVSVWAKVIGGGQGFMAVDWSGGTDPSVIPWDGWAYTTVSDTWEFLTWTGKATSSKVTVFFDSYGTTTLFDDFSPATAPVPEPASLLTLGTGLMGLFGMIRRRK